MRGSAPEGSCGQSAPRVNPEVQTQVALDAIVSNKTFGNATSVPICLGQFSKFRRLQIRLSLKSFEKVTALREPGFMDTKANLAEYRFYSVSSQNGTILVLNGTIRFVLHAINFT